MHWELFRRAKIVLYFAIPIILAGLLQSQKEKRFQIAREIGRFPVHFVKLLLGHARQAHQIRLG